MNGKNISFDQLATRDERLPYLSQIVSDVFNEHPKPIVLFGSGNVGKVYLEYLRNIENVTDIVFCDNDSSKSGTTIEGALVISFEKFKEEYSDSYIVISSIDYFDEILLKLKENHLAPTWIQGIDYLSVFDFLNEEFLDYDVTVKDNLEMFKSAYNLMSDEVSKKIFLGRINYCITGNPEHLIPLRSWTPHYFAPDIITLSDEEVFVDGGAFTGDTLVELLRQTGGNFKKIYAFEPEVSKHEAFLSVADGNENIELLPFGLWRKKDVLRFAASNNVCSSLDSGGNIEIPVISIDEVLSANPVTFIKMDIEGAEVEALKGAEKSIRKYKSKLAISAYHLPLDLV